jgi:hypothetical protein
MQALRYQIFPGSSPLAHNVFGAYESRRRIAGTSGLQRVRGCYTMI